MPVSHKMAYRPDIDGLRAVAILLVCIFHFRLLPIGEAGFIGVDIFFVISGFLITRIITDGLSAGKFRLGTFYYRRVRRLYPAMLVVLVLYLLAGWILFLPALFEELAWETLFSSIYGINIYLWRSVNYFGVQADSKPLLHMWSLAVEEQFYLFYPLFLIGLYRLCRGRSGQLLGIVVVFMLGSFALGWFASYWKPQAAFYLLPTRAWELMAGGVLAMVVQRGPLPKAFVRLAGPAAVLLLGAAMVLHHGQIAFPGWFAALPVLSGVLFIVAGQDMHTPLSRLLSSRPMVFFGNISYPLYLVHWPVKIILQDGFAEDTLILRASGFGLSILLAAVIYACVETPVRTGRWLPAPQRFLGLTAGLQAGVLAVCALIFTTQGLPARFDPQVRQVLSYTSDAPREFIGCEYSSGGVRFDCIVGDADAVPETLLIGDSHLYALSGALDLMLRQQGASAVLSFAYGCLPVRDAGRFQCRDFVRDVFARAENTPQIKTVLIASAWTRPYSAGGSYFYDGVLLQGASGLKMFETKLAETVVRLQQAGKAVILVDPMYRARHPVPQALARAAAFGTQWPLDMPRADYDAQFAHLFAQFEALQERGVRRVSLVDDLCRSGTCPALWNGKPVFTDATHMARHMQGYFAQVLADSLADMF